MKNLLNRANCAGGSSLSNRNIHLTFHRCLISRKTNSVSSFTFVWKWSKKERERGKKKITVSKQNTKEKNNLWNSIQLQNLNNQSLKLFQYRYLKVSPIINSTSEKQRHKILDVQMFNCTYTLLSGAIQTANPYFKIRYVKIFAQSYKTLAASYTFY